MKKLLGVFFFVAIATTPAFALLSPFSQSIREMEQILESRELNQYFHQNEKLTEIKREDENHYVLKSEDKQVIVEVIYLPPQRVGPREFKLVFHPAKTL